MCQGRITRTVPTGFFAVRGPASDITVPQKVGQKSSGAGRSGDDPCFSGLPSKAGSAAYEHKGKTIGGRAFAILTGSQKMRSANTP